jgi:Protein of unknown function (DUF3489)
MSKKSSKLNKMLRITKANIIVKLLQRNTGATVAEMAKATGWQPHSVQGFMSGMLKKKRRLNIKSLKETSKDRRYFIGEEEEV